MGASIREDYGHHTPCTERADHHYHKAYDNPQSKVAYVPNSPWRGVSHSTLNATDECNDDDESEVSGSSDCGESSGESYDDDEDGSEAQLP